MRLTQKIKVLIVVVVSLFFSLSIAEAGVSGGFIESAGSFKFGDDKAEKNDTNLLELRAQLRYRAYPEILEEYSGEAFIKFEVLADGYDESVSPIVREGWLSLSPVDFMDIKAGRQIVTWGTGDMLFVNDLFPKDYLSFFIGRDDEYLKLPIDGLKVSLFGEKLSTDIIVMPVFTPNNSLIGERLSIFDPISGRIAGEELDRFYEMPPKTPRNLVTAIRVYRSYRGVESALYFYDGFYGEPKGIIDPLRERFFYPRLRSYGASLRGALFGGIANIEGAYYDSRDDSDGSNASVENSSMRVLAGFERELPRNIGLGLQYMVDKLLDYGAYKRNLDPTAKARDEFRSLLTVRLTKLLMADTLRLSLFNFYSPTDSDDYLRISAAYDIDDNIKATLGGNFFTGKYDHTEFGQLEGNDNLYLRVRYSF